MQGPQLSGKSKLEQGEQEEGTEEMEGSCWGQYGDWAETRAPVRAELEKPQQRVAE